MMLNGIAFSDEHQEMINHEYHYPDVQKVATFPLPVSFSFLKKVKHRNSIESCRVSDSTVPVYQDISHLYIDYEYSEIP